MGGLGQKRIYDKRYISTVITARIVDIQHILVLPVTKELSFSLIFAHWLIFFIIFCNWLVLIHLDLLLGTLKRLSPQSYRLLGFLFFETIARGCSRDKLGGHFGDGIWFQ